MAVVGEEPVETGNTDAFIEDAAGRIALAEEHGLSARVDKALEGRERFNEWASAFYCKQQEYVIKCLSPLKLAKNVGTEILQSGLVGIVVASDPAAHIKTWNRKQEIVDIIKEALLIKGKSNG
jgi:hypothetical protein